MQNTIKGLFDFEVPKLWNADDESNILRFLNEIAECAYILKNNESDKVVADYECFLDNLIDIIGAYNYYINTNKLSEKLITSVVDEEKTALLGEDIKYKIYKVAEL